MVVISIPFPAVPRETNGREPVLYKSLTDPQRQRGRHFQSIGRAHSEQNSFKTVESAAALSHIEDVYPAIDGAAIREAHRRRATSKLGRPSYRDGQRVVVVAALIGAGGGAKLDHECGGARRWTMYEKNPRWFGSLGNERPAHFLRDSRTDRTSCRPGGKVSS